MVTGFGVERGGQIAHEESDYALEKVFFAVDVAVQRHCLDVELLRQGSHRQALRPRLIDDPQRILNDQLAAESFGHRSRRHHKMSLLSIHGENPSSRREAYVVSDNSIQTP